MIRFIPTSIISYPISSPSKRLFQSLTTFNNHVEPHEKVREPKGNSGNTTISSPPNCLDSGKTVVNPPYSKIYDVEYDPHYTPKQKTKSNYSMAYDREFPL